ncbi:retrovirus-related pol polyprotein from transposon TNT 1-94 [Tanacetum coccineum]
MCMFALIMSTDEPTNIKEVMVDHTWIKAKQEELHQFDRLKVWELVEKPFKKTIIKLKWLWKNKKDEDNTAIRNKARLVAKGYAQEEGIDFEESFAPEETLRFLSALHQRPQRKEINTPYYPEEDSIRRIERYKSMERINLEDIKRGPYSKKLQYARHFKTLSLDELRLPDFNLLSDQEYSKEEEAEGMAETMEQYMSKTRTDFESGVPRPKIDNKDQFELEGQFLKELRENTFSGLDVGSVNIPYLLAQYLRRFAAGRKSGAHISDDTWAWVAMRPERQPDAAAGAPRMAQDAPVIDEGGQADPAPVQAPPPPPPAAARTMPQRMARLEEDVHEIRGMLAEQREVISATAHDFSRFYTWTTTSLARMMDMAGVTYTSYFESLIEYTRRVRCRTEGASTSTAQQDPQQPEP